MDVISVKIARKEESKSYDYCDIGKWFVIVHSLKKHSLKRVRLLNK